MKQQTGNQYHYIFQKQKLYCRVVSIFFALTKLKMSFLSIVYERDKFSDTYKEYFDAIRDVKEILHMYDTIFSRWNIVMRLLEVICIPRQFGSICDTLRFFDLQYKCGKYRNWHRRVEPLIPIHSYVLKEVVPLQNQSYFTVAQTIEDLLTSKIAKPLYREYDRNFSRYRGIYFPDSFREDQRTKHRFSDPSIEMWLGMLSMAKIERISYDESSGLPTHVEVLAVLDVYSTYALRKDQGEHSFALPPNAFCCSLKRKESGSNDSKSEVPTGLDLNTLLIQLQQNPQLKEQLKSLLFESPPSSSQPQCDDVSFLDDIIMGGV